ncbi:MAG: hypothetical protein MJ240_00735 [Kiritimatiellae bacterium]|nr:hypothetical protein [Kiritimatiellia bacterium]
MKNNFALVAVLASTLVWVGYAQPEFVVPETLYAAPGLECNVYFKNVFTSVVPQRFAFRAAAALGRSELTRWCWTPAAADAGKSVPVVFEAWDDSGLVAAATTTVQVAAQPSETLKAKRTTLALFAASITNSRYQDQLLADMREAGYANYVPVGARKGKPIKEGELVADHDGYGGYTFNTFLTRYKVSNEEIEHIQDAAEREQLKSLGLPEKIVHAWQRALLRSPLMRFRNGMKVLDVQAWLDDVNGGQPIDYVVIELGCNSVFSYTGEIPEVRARFRAEVTPSARELVAALRKCLPNATYAFCNQIIGCSQDGFAANYGARWNEMQFRKVAFGMNAEIEALVREFNDPKVKFVPFMQGIDPFNSYIRGNVPAHARSEEKVWRDVNAVHPSAAGGRQLGDTLAAWLMNDLTRK